MPFESQAQRRFMYATNPKMAKRFEKKTKKKNLPEKVKKSPMDLAMRLLKRQTELGEFHEDFPSSLGPVTEYHGTMNLPAVSEQGIKARSSRKRSKKYVPEQLRGQDITYTTPDRERALAFAQERAQSLGLPSSQVGVVGVRAGGLPSPIQHQEPFGVLGGTMSNVRPSAIPRANIVPVLKMPLYHGTSKEAAESIMQQGLLPTGGHAPQLFEHSPEEIREAMQLAGIDPSKYDELIGGYDDEFGFAYAGENKAMRHAASWAEDYHGDDATVLEIDETHPDMPFFMHEPSFPQPYDSPYEGTPLDYGFNSHKGQVRTPHIIPPHLIRIVPQSELKEGM